MQFILPLAAAKRKSLPAASQERAGRLSLLRFVDLTSAGPARLYGIARKGRIAAGYDADLTVVDLKRRETITGRWVVSRPGWTPFDGVGVTGWPVGTFVRGRKVMWQGELPTPSQGQRCGFWSVSNRPDRLRVFPNRRLPNPPLNYKVRLRFSGEGGNARWPGLPALGASLIACFSRRWVVHERRTLFTQDPRHFRGGAGARIAASGGVAELGPGGIRRSRACGRFSRRL
jgi:hypothetical protein